jgi:hypothetical protein
MASRASKIQKKSSSFDTVIVFGESHNDSQAISTLIEALRPDLRVIAYRSPTVLIHRDSAHRANIQKNIAQIKAVARAAAKRNNVVAVVLHKDCDAVEPAHAALAHAVEGQMGANSYITIAAAPAWEIETWWYLWPDAVSSYHPTWRRLGRSGTSVGLIENAKETLIRELRVKGGVVRDYRESDAVGIARHVKSLGIVNAKNAISQAFDQFSVKVGAI